MTYLFVEIYSLQMHYPYSNLMVKANCLSFYSFESHCFMEANLGDSFAFSEVYLFAFGYLEAISKGLKMFSWPLCIYQTYSSCLHLWYICNWGCLYRISWNSHASSGSYWWLTLDSPLWESLNVIATHLWCMSLNHSSQASSTSRASQQAEAYHLIVADFLAFAFCFILFECFKSEKGKIIDSCYLLFFACTFCYFLDHT